MIGTDPSSSESSREADRHAVIDVLNRYAEALDHRDWALLDDVFLPDVTADYGVGALTGREAIVRSITDLLGVRPLPAPSWQRSGGGRRGSCP
jgi:hypothetical protein